MTPVYLTAIYTSFANNGPCPQSCAVPPTVIATASQLFAYFSQTSNSDTNDMCEIFHQEKLQTGLFPAR